MANLVSDLSSASADNSLYVDDSDLKNLETCLELCKKVNACMARWVILVNIQTQMLHLYDLKNREWTYSCFISTAANGPGQVEDSFQTPLGLHQVEEKIGDGSHPYAIFKSRKDTGEIAIVNNEVASIVGRILRLRGLEEGYNLGKDSLGQVVDSYDRYIYIHGTNDIKSLGKPASQGCVRMHPDRMISLFDTVSEKTPVYIY